MKFKSPNLTVDGIIFRGNTILLIKRKHEPFEGKWALPGGFVEYGETTEKAVIREILEETGLETKVKKLLGVYSDPNRDPRGHTVSVVYLLDELGGKLKGRDDASEAKFFQENQLPELSFDHEKIIKDYLLGR